MFDLTTLSLFTAAVIVLALTPGPDLFLIIGRGISQGRRAALFTVLGFFLAGAVQVPLLALGLAALVAQNPVLFDLLRYAGGAYLIWRGIKMITAAGRDMAGPQGAVSASVAIREGFVASLVNPKSHVFLLAFLPQFVDPTAGSVALQFLVLGLLMRAIALVVEAALALLSGRIGQRLRQSRALSLWLERAAGGLILAVGLRLMLMERPEMPVGRP